VGNAAKTGLCRVTIIATTTRVDLALPEDVPLADLAPTLLRYAGDDIADAGLEHGGWVLSRLGSGVLDSARTPAQLEIRDGEQLYLTPRSKSAPEAVFDDVVDAIATANQNRGGRWRPATTRRFSITVAVTALLLGAVLTALAGPPQLPGALVALGVGAALLMTAAVLSRAIADSRLGALLGAVALPYATVGGLLVFAGDRALAELAAPHIVVAATALLLYSVVAALAVSDQVHAFLAGAVCGAALLAGGLLAMLTNVAAAGAAAVVAVVVLAATSMLPMLAFRLARLPMPSIPAGPDDLKTDTETVDGQRVLTRSEDADRYLSGLLLATGVIGFGAEAYLVAAGSWSAWTLSAVVALVMIIRARVFPGVGQRLPLLVAGFAGLGLLVIGGSAAGSTLLRLTALLGAVLCVGVACLVHGLSTTGKRATGSPVWGRLLDIVEVALIVALVPITLAVCDLYGWVRSLSG